MSTPSDIEMSAVEVEASMVVSHLHHGLENCADGNLSAQPSKSFYDLACVDMRLRNFFTITGNYWPDSDASFFARANFIVSKVAILACAALLATATAFYIKLSVSLYSNWSYYGVLVALYLMLFLATLSVLPAQYCNRFRLSTPLEVEDIKVIN